MNTIRRGLGAAQARISARGGRQRRWRPLWAAGWVAVTALVMVLPAKNSHSGEGDASQGVHEVTWIHASPAEGSSFGLFVSPVSGSLAAGAIGQNGLLSVLSEWRRAQPSRPGQPLFVEP
jgi:hypothetical protein